jgi:site-specific DNA-methyltransferase (adenine-specific)
MTIYAPGDESKDEYEPWVSLLRKEKRTTATLTTKLGKLYNQDCVEFLESLQSESVDLIFADPPYNINKAEWDTFESQEQYVQWSMAWIKESHRVLKKTGTLYICGFSEILADIKWASARMFAGCKWLVWYYRNKANLGNDWGRSHESLLHLRKSQNYTFNIDEARVPYNQHTLRYPVHPQATTSAFGNGKKHDWQPHPMGAKPRDVIELPTLCNTTKERTVHPTQKPFDLLRRIVLVSSDEGQVVVDPFGGSGTTFVVAERFKRYWLGSELSHEYCTMASHRILNPQEYCGDRTELDDLTLEKRRDLLRHG